MKYKKGDKVRIIADNSDHDYKIGSEVIIQECFWSGWCNINVLNEYGKYLSIQIEEIELIEDKPKIDPIVTSVMTQLLTRSQLGISKYGTTLHDNNKDDFMQHLKEELMDAILYIEKEQSKKL